MREYLWAGSDERVRVWCLLPVHQAWWFIPALLRTGKCFLLSLLTEGEKKTKAGGGEERCSLSIVIKHDRMQFQSAATFPVESWRCLDRTMLLYCSVAINTFTDVLFFFFFFNIFSTQSWTERAKGLTADAADLKKRKRAEGGTVGALENGSEPTEGDESSAKKKKSLDSGSSKLSAFAYTKN